MIRENLPEVAQPVEEEAKRSHNVNVEAASGLTRVLCTGVDASQNLSCEGDLYAGKALSVIWELINGGPKLRL